MRSAIIIVGFAGALLAADMTEQAKRGSELFFRTTKGLPCATCHQLEGKGTPAGPDLKNIAVATPRGMVMAILSTRTAYVQQVEMKNGKRYTVIQHQETPDSIIYYDLGGKTPVEVTLKKADIARKRDNATWMHPPESVGYTSQELADVIAYIKFICRGSTDTVTAAEVKK
jgi:putative heme-binding domain-containing protein